MRIFDEFPKNDKCPICKTGKAGKCVLIAIDGTNKDGGMTHQAKIVHLECVELRFEPTHKLIYQKIES